MGSAVCCVYSSVQAHAPWTVSLEVAFCSLAGQRITLATHYFVMVLCIYTYKRERVCVTQISSRFSAACFPLPASLPVLYYRITTVYVQRTLHIRWLRIRSTGTQQTPLPQRVNDRPGSAELANPSSFISR